MLANENLRSKHIRTLEVLRSVTKENAELKTRCKELSIEGGVLKDRLAEAERNAAEEETKRVRAEEMDSLRARVEKLTARERSLEHDFLKMKMHASEVEHDRQNLGKELRRLKEALRDAARAETSRGAKEEEETSRIRSKLTDAIAKNKSPKCDRGDEAHGNIEAESSKGEAVDESALCAAKQEIDALRGMCKTYREQVDSMSEQLKQSRKETTDASLLRKASQEELRAMRRALADSQRRVENDFARKIVDGIIEFANAENRLHEDECNRIRREASDECESLQKSIDHYERSLETADMELTSLKTHNEYLEASALEIKHKTARLNDAIQNAAQAFESVVVEADGLFFEKGRTFRESRMTTSSRSGRRIHARDPVKCFYPGLTLHRRKRRATVGLSKPSKKQVLHPHLDEERDSTPM
eukprot:g1393.t1